MILQHYRLHGRSFPWRETSDPYRIVLSELMLQQTQTRRVLAKYEVFLKRFPTFESVARAPVRLLLREWRGLGYNRRALALKRLAACVVKTHGGRLPSSKQELLTLPGVGPYTAAAIRAFVFNQPEPMIETNIRTVYLETFLRERRSIEDRLLLALIAGTLYRRDPRRWFYALMDYGVYLKERGSKAHRRSAHYRKQSTFEGSFRQLRGKILREMTKGRSFTVEMLSRELGRPSAEVEKACRVLKMEGFLARQGKTYSAPR